MAAVKDFSVEEKLVTLLRLQKIDSKLDEIQILKGELPMEVSDLEDEIQGLTARQTSIEEEINGITEFIEGKKTRSRKVKADRQIRKAERERKEQPRVRSHQ
jgi:predicted  nucleic acid-binding Zn-ribbon protein